MVTMTFQYGRFFRFILILLEKKVGDPHFLFGSMFLNSKNNYLAHFKKICCVEIFNCNKTRFSKIKKFYTKDFFKRGLNDCFYYLETFNQIKSGGHRPFFRVK